MDRCLLLHRPSALRLAASTVAARPGLQIFKREEMDPESAFIHECKATLKVLLAQCDAQELLEPLIANSTPFPVLKMVLREALKGLKIQPPLRKSFVTSGALQRLQAIALQSDLPPKLDEVIREINAQFPQDVVLYYMRDR